MSFGKLIPWVCFLLINAISWASHGRIFDMSKESFGSYLKYNYSPWTTGNTTPFANSSGDSVSFSKAFGNIPAYEFGFLFNGRKLNWSFGFEVVSPSELVDNVGTDATGATTYYTMTNNVSVVVPKVALELNLKTWQESRMFIRMDYGMANLTLQNAYTMTAAGTTQFGVSSFREELKANLQSYSGTFCYETLLSDTTTFSFELGYRSMNFTAMTHNLAVTNFQGAVTVGSAAYNNGGVTARSLDLTGYTGGASLRFYIY